MLRVDSVYDADLIGILPDNIRTLANQWRNPETIARLSPFGRRLHALWSQGELSASDPREFSKAVELGVSTFEAHLTKQLDRNNREASSMRVEEALKYARYAKVSVGWLLTGDGRRLAAGYGLDGDEAMLKRYPEPLQRAARAFVELEGLTPKLALEFVAEVYKDNGSVDENADFWFSELKRALKKSAHSSGTRPSTKQKIG